MAKRNKEASEAIDVANMTVDERLKIIGNLYVERDIAKEVFADIDRMLCDNYPVRSASINLAG